MLVVGNQLYVVNGVYFIMDLFLREITSIFEKGF